LASQVTFVFAPMGLLIIGIILGIVLLLLGVTRKNRRFVGWGEVLLGLSVFTFPMLFYLDKALDTWVTFVPTAGEVAILGSLTFVGGVFTTLGLQNLLTKDS